jgi:hypothetical protein
MEQTWFPSKQKGNRIQEVGNAAPHALKTKLEVQVTKSLLLNKLHLVACSLLVVKWQVNH